MKNIALTFQKLWRANFNSPCYDIFKKNIEILNLMAIRDEIKLRAISIGCCKEMGYIHYTSNIVMKNGKFAVHLP